ncbi:MAG: nickel pincer cofactor biosynthesis protein LarB [Chloroflexi bacterium]|nr:nickel pincer cofactor biosynthesis protein LarB [Chloroflexota bacterium]MCI0771777.1 nickel pincer cofactor biosynthesis protein LarB [Chloroflexota bacterium]
MDESRLRTLLKDFKDNGLSEDEVITRLRGLPFEDLGFAKVDHHRAIRQGFPEVIFGEGKTPEQVASIGEALLKQSDRLLVTRASRDAYDAVVDKAPDARYDDIARTIVVDRRDVGSKKAAPGILIVCAGTADLPVAYEAAITAELMDSQVERVFDVGVAGLHRLLAQLPALQKARVVVAVAGMEGALPSVVGGLVQVPVIAVPTSVGYGASFDGLAALLSMLNSCATGIGVVNIDNGFGAGYLAALINSLPTAVLD